MDSQAQPQTSLHRLSGANSSRGKAAACRGCTERPLPPLSSQASQGLQGLLLRSF